MISELLVRTGLEDLQLEAVPVSAADRLIDLKRLLDAGAISQSEYDSKKGELLQSV